MVTFRKKYNKNSFKLEIKSKIKQLKKFEFEQKLRNLKLAYNEAKRLSWDTKRLKTKHKIVEYIISIFSGKEDEELANELNRANDIYTCMAWLDVNFA